MRYVIVELYDRDFALWRWAIVDTEKHKVYGYYQRRLDASLALARLEPRTPA